MLKKIATFIFILSIAVAAAYLIFIPHTIRIQHIHNVRISETITTYPLSHSQMFLGAIKIFAVVNLPNYFIIAYWCINKRGH